MPPLAILGGLAIGGSIIGAVGANSAAGKQANAELQAAQLQHQDQQASLDFQKQQYATSQQQIAPWLKAGTQGIGSLSQLLSTPGQGLLTPWTNTFQAPTAAQAQQTPGYQFALEQGQNAIQNSAAARGGLLSTGTQKTLDQFSQGLASQTYSDTYNRALGEYQQNYNIFQGNQSNTFNRLASLSGIGQQAATTSGQLGQQAAGNVANINIAGGAQQGQMIAGAGAARASGYAGIANSLNSGLGNVSQYLMLQQAGLLGQGQLGSASDLSNAGNLSPSVNYIPTP